MTTYVNVQGSSLTAEALLLAPDVEIVQTTSQMEKHAECRVPNRHESPATVVETDKWFRTSFDGEHMITAVSKRKSIDQ